MEIQNIKRGERVMNVSTDEYGTIMMVHNAGEKDGLMMKSTAFSVKYDGIDHYNFYPIEDRVLFAHVTVVPAIAPAAMLGAGDDGVPSPGKQALPHDSAERKTYPLMTAFIDYFPSAIAALANHSYVSNEKHNPGQPVHWSRDKSGDHLDAAARHLLERDLRGLAWRALAALQMQLEAEGHPVAPAAR